MLQQLRLFRRGVLLVGPMLLLYACSGGAPKPQRKKMPGLNNLNSQWEIPYTTQQQVFNFPVRTDYVDLLQEGKAATFLAVNFADDNFDSLALSLANSYKAMAPALLEQWAQQQGTGILIDLRQPASTNTQRSEYLLENAGYSIPLIFLYDQASASRANTFMTVLQSVPSIHCKLTNATHTDKNGVRSDCFSNY
ncbi:hypothetical protein A4H97_24340 [Niastella yeongjuensis]|uniref:Uncharacterized protein n=1 Tax=Niastella yeongjuensis TaxID=354355 RepID=A0A1V9F3A3_9BACT|nr:hypothetical protein [Niastella yeongjuensis]OQP52830.1 hypothetical protein A4H97_24340 [Niastella yeongjuensis]SEP20703.1 hypothetical protein SAMN05660816_04756 [Niastella yeongjuensis]